MIDWWTVIRFGSGESREQDKRLWRFDWCLLSNLHTKTT